MKKKEKKRRLIPQIRACNHPKPQRNNSFWFKMCTEDSERCFCAIAVSKLGCIWGGLARCQISDKKGKHIAWHSHGVHRGQTRPRTFLRTHLQNEVDFRFTRRASLVHRDPEKTALTSVVWGWRLGDTLRERKSVCVLPQVMNYSFHSSHTFPVKWVIACLDFLKSGVVVLFNLTHWFHNFTPRAEFREVQVRPRGRQKTKQTKGISFFFMEKKKFISREEAEEEMRTTFLCTA